MNLIVPGALVAVSAVLGSILAYQATAPVPPIAVPRVSVRSRQPIPLMSDHFSPPPEASFALINTRSPFSPNRQAVAEPVTPGSGIPPLDVTLVGVIMGEGKSLAILKPPGPSVASMASTGQSVEGWQIVRIYADHVVFHANGTDYDLRLTVPSSAVVEKPAASVRRSGDGL